MSEHMGGRTNKTRRFTSADRVAVSAGCVALLAGVVVLVLGHGILSSTIGMYLLGVAGIAFVALVFLLVGESEDRHYRKGAL